MWMTKEQRGTLDSNKSRGCEEPLSLWVCPSVPRGAQLHRPRPQGTGAALLPAKDGTRVQPALGHELELCKPCADPSASRGEGCAWCGATASARCCHLPLDTPRSGTVMSLLPEEPSVTSKRMRTEKVSHDALSMRHGVPSCPAIYKTSRAEELAVYETQRTERINSFQLIFLWLRSLPLSCGYTAVTLGSLQR